MVKKIGLILCGKKTLFRSRIFKTDCLKSGQSTRKVQEIEYKKSGSSCRFSFGRYMGLEPPGSFERDPPSLPLDSLWDSPINFRFPSLLPNHSQQTGREISRML